MRLEKKRAKSSPKQALQRYLFPTTIISSMLISGLIGYTASTIAISNQNGDWAKMNTPNNQTQIAEARNNSLKVIETEIPKIINDLEKYNQDLNLLAENVQWLKENLASIRDTTSEFDTAISVIRNINTVAKIPLIDKYSTDLAFAQIKLGEIDSILLRMEDLSVIQQEMSDSHQKLNLLYEEYQKEKSIEQLLQMEQVLNSNLIYQIEDLRNATIEAREVFELSSDILITVDKGTSLLKSVQETMETTLDTIQFWKDNDVNPEIGSNIKEDMGKDLAVSKEEIQNLPDDLAKQSKDSITSISNVQKELQVIRIAQMLINE